MRKGYTLAEVLITLGVIGVVSAMTIPVIIQKYHNHVVETKLKKVYTVMNQAMRMSEIDNGERQYWHTSLRTKEGIEQYILPYIKYVKVEEDTNANAIYFSDGTILRASKIWIGEWHFYTMDIDKCHKFEHYNGTCMFMFNSYTDKYYFEGYYIVSEPSLNTLKNTNNYGCYTKGNYCSLLIEKNGWKIPSDYPYRVR